MIRIARTTVGVLATVAGGAALAFAAAPAASAAPQVSICPGLPGQSTSTETCEVGSGPTGLTLAITVDGGTAGVTGDNFSGPAAIALGDGAVVNMTGQNPGLSIGIAGPGAVVTIDGRSAPTCGNGAGFAGDFQTGKGCLNTGTMTIPLG
jgi:hypothetical protein